MHTMKLFAHRWPFRIAALLDWLVQALGKFSATTLEVMDGKLRAWQLGARLNDRTWQQCAL